MDDGFYITGKKIEKMLERGENVIVDRYTLSAKVYAESTTSVNMVIISVYILYYQHRCLDYR